MRAPWQTGGPDAVSLGLTSSRLGIVFGHILRACSHGQLVHTAASFARAISRIGSAGEREFYTSSLTEAVLGLC